MGQSDPCAVPGHPSLVPDLPDDRAQALVLFGNRIDAAPLVPGS
jgi:hypothetical protein